MKLEVADGIRKVRLGTYKKTGDKAETEWLERNRLGTEAYAGWCGRTAGVTPPPTRSVWDSFIFQSEGRLIFVAEITLQYPLFATGNRLLVSF